MKLFISYSSKDRELVTTLADDLDLMDHEVWFDRELNRSGGHQWWKLICSQIRECEGFIYALSPHILSSVPCQREYGYARALGKPVLPLILTDLDYRYLPRDLQEAQLVNFRTRTTEQRRALKESLRNLPPCPSLPTNALELEPSVPLDPVGELIDRIHNLTTDPDQQKLLILDIDDLGEDQKYTAQVPELLQLLVKRDDVLTGRNLRRAQELLEKTSVTSSINANPQPPRIEVINSPTSSTAPTRQRSVDLLPAPFAWIEIPRKGYSIAKYPVTNAQFRLFVEAGGYSERKWWTETGWTQREEDGWTEPRFWQDKQWNVAEQPVVGVSWYESVAFCLWLSDVTGQKIMLPTEDQWQYAAQGDDGRAYPWGNEWDCKKCGNSVKPCNSKVTTPVRQYEGQGDSPFGVVDMAGNVWEWCLTDYDNQTNDLNNNANSRVLRGGSWISLDTVLFRCAYRNGDYPHGGNVGVGFRPVFS